MLLSLVQPGLGQLYNRQTAKAFVCLAVLPLLIVLVALFGLAHTFRGFLLFGITSLVFQLGVAVEGGVVGFRRHGGTALPRLRRWVVAVFLILAATNVILIVSNAYTSRLLGLRAFVIRSNSMTPTLHVGDRVVADMNAYGHVSPKRGDIVVFQIPSLPNTIYAKRVAAVGGDTIQVAGRAVTVNGSVSRDPPVAAATTNNRIGVFGPVNVPTGAVFVLGDDLADSYDSRYFGSVPVQSVLGKLLFVYWSNEHSRIGENFR